MGWRTAYALTIAVILAVSQAARAGDVFPQVIVSVAPLKPYMDVILEGRGNAQSLLRPGQEPHNFALSVSQAEMLERADILVIPDRAMSPFLTTLAGKYKRLRVIELSSLPGAAPLPYPQHNPWLEALKSARGNEKGLATDKKNHAHHHGDNAVNADKKPITDPHLWLDPERMAALALPLAEAIGSQAPQAAAELRANAKALAQHLTQEVSPAMRAILSAPAKRATSVGKPIIPFITFHAAYQYFMARFGLEDYGALLSRPEGYMGTRSLANALQGAKKLHVRCIIAEEPSALVRRLAEDTQARLVLLSPEQLVAPASAPTLPWIKNDYDRFLLVTAKQFAECF